MDYKKALNCVNNTMKIEGYNKKVISGILKRMKQL